MEIFLLLVVIALVVIFYFNNKTQVTSIQQELGGLKKYVQLLQHKLEQGSLSAPVNSATQDVSKPIENSFATPIIEKEIVVTPPITIPEIEQKEVTINSEIPKVTHVEVSETQLNQPIIQQPVYQKPPVYTPQESWYDKFRKNNPDIEKFIGENLVSKIGIAILVIGIAFFVKFAIDENWINEIARVGIGILCGVIVLGFAHKLQAKFSAFSSVLVAGGISIFYFTIGIAFHQYHIFNQATAFVLMLIITSFAVFTSILYNRMELAALSLIGGFATPFMVSTGEGNYIVLFTYVLILDIGMLVLAYLRKWNLINILTYLFTVVLYVGWLQNKAIGQENAPYKGALIFGFVFYVVFIIMNVINNIKEKRAFKVIDICILLSNSFVFYLTGMQILSYYHPEWKGLYTIIFGIFNLACAWLLYKKYKADEKLIYLMIGLTLTFITLAAPVQLQGNYITLFWALEAVLLMWLAQKSNIVLYRFVSFIVTVLMLFSLLLDWINVYGASHFNDIKSVPEIILNKGFITGFVSSLSLLAVVMLLRKEEATSKYLGITFHPKNYSVFLKITFVISLYLTGLIEVIYQSGSYFDLGYTVVIITVVYHLLFFVIINLLIKPQASNTLKVINFILNYVNCGLFVLAFSLIPLSEFKANLYDANDGQIGFILHYVSIAAVIYLAYRMYQTRHENNSPIVNMRVLNTTLCAMSIVYISSSELILHVAKFIIEPLASASNFDLVSLKMDEYSVLKTNVVKIGFPILWGVLAFVFLYVGMKKQNKTLRVLSLILLGITLIKLFTYDISNASKAGKIVAFIILGLLLLIISFMYQKIKTLLIDETDKKQITDTTINSNDTKNNETI